VRTFLDGFMTWLVAVLSLTMVSMQANGITDLSLLTHFDVLTILALSLGSTVKGVHSFRKNPQASQ
jgi:hypothetical protein